MPSRKKQSPSPARPARDRYIRPSTRAAAGPPRTQVHLSMPQEIVDGINELLWMRVTAASGSVEGIKGGKAQIYDEAVEAFLQQFEHQSCEELKEPAVASGWRSQWILDRLYKRCKKVSKREDVSVGRVVSHALKIFIERIMTPECRGFTRETAERAYALLAREPGGLGSGMSGAASGETPISRSSEDR